MTNRLNMAVDVMHQINQEAAVARASLLGLRAELETMIISRASHISRSTSSPTAGEMQQGARYLQSPLITLRSDLLGIQSPRAPSVASTTIIPKEALQQTAQASQPARITDVLGASGLTTVFSFVRVDTGNLACHQPPA